VAASLALDPLLAEDPAFLPALQARAQFESWAGNYDQALATYGRLQEITPEDRSIGLNRARVLSWASRFDAAVAAYDSILRRNPRDTEALVGLGTVLAWASRPCQRSVCDSPTHAAASLGVRASAARQRRSAGTSRPLHAAARARPRSASAFPGSSSSTRL
jgi:tetratricopeptide (TPR) repeat protein